MGIEDTIKDAQAFIDSMKEFQNDNNGSVHYSRSDPSSSDDNSLQDNLSQAVDQSSLPANISDLTLASPFGNNGSGNINVVNTTPVGKFLEEKEELNGFRTISFSRKSDYEQPFRADVLTYIEVYYYENKKLPEVHVLHEHFKSHPDRPNFLKGWNGVLDDISNSLQNRGIKPYNTVENYIDPKFAWATSLIVNHLDKRTIPAKLKEAGLSTKEWQALLRRKRHFEYFQSRLDEVFDNDVKNDAKLALAKSIQNGDLQAIKYYNELKNIYRPETQNALQMVSLVLTAVMEILAQNVTSDVLNRVAAEIRSSPSVRKVIEANSS